VVPEAAAVLEGAVDAAVFVREAVAASTVDGHNLTLVLCLPAGATAAEEAAAVAAVDDALRAASVRAWAREEWVWVPLGWYLDTSVRCHLAARTKPVAHEAHVGASLTRCS
jgi:hypothetical protein